MALNPIRPRLRNISNDVAKVQIIVPAGDEIEVSEDVAAQIAHQRAPLVDTSAPASGPKVTEAPAEDLPAEVAEEPSLEEHAKPSSRKRASRKADA